MGTKNIKINSKLYKNLETGGITENLAGEQTIQTKETKILKGSNGKEKEVLIGKDIEETENTKDGYDTLQRKIMEKLMK